MPYSELIGLVVLESLAVAVSELPESLSVLVFSPEHAGNQRAPANKSTIGNFFIAVGFLLMVALLNFSAYGK